MMLPVLSEYFPAGHSMQSAADTLPCALLYFPAPHGVQAVLPATRPYLPFSHAVQMLSEVPPVANPPCFPAGQGCAELSPGHQCASGHEMHEVDPGNVPGSQHDTASGFHASVNVPDQPLE